MIQAAWPSEESSCEDYNRTGRGGPRGRGRKTEGAKRKFREVKILCEKLTDISHDFENPCNVQQVK